MRKNFKARMTAKNMNITEYNKETLIRLMIFASQIGELNSNEAKRTIELSRKWEITNLSKINSVRSLKRLKETGWLEQQDISDYIAILVDILSQSDFFDIQQTLISMLNQYALDYKDLEPEALPDVLKEIRFSNVDFSNQFYGNNGKREISQSEKYANFMYLSNQLAHAFCANVVGMQNWQTNHLVQELFKIKIWCVHKLIEEKSHGALMDVSIRKIQTGDEGNFPNCIISFSIPNYMEPFSVHMNDGCLSKEELAQCDGIDRYNQLGLRTSFPQYLSDEKMKLLEHLYEDKFQKATYKRGKNLQWLFETKAILQEKEQKKIKNTPSKFKTKYVGNKNNTKAIDIKKENEKTLRKLARSLGVKLPKYFKDGFLVRTSYSINQYIEDVKPEITVALLQKGIPSEKIDAEIAKLIIFMKITKPFSAIVKSPKEEKKEQALEALEDYSEGYAYIELYSGETTDYSELKSGARKYANELASKRIAKQQAKMESSEILDDGFDYPINDQTRINEAANIQDNRENSLKVQETNAVQAMTPERAQALEDEITQLNTEVNELTDTIQVLMEKLKKAQERIINIHTELRNSIPSKDEGRD